MGKRVSWVELYLDPSLGHRGFLWLLTGWMVMCAVLGYYDGRNAPRP